MRTGLAVVLGALAGRGTVVFWEWLAGGELSAPAAIAVATLAGIWFFEEFRLGPPWTRENHPPS